MWKYFFNSNDFGKSVIVESWCCISFRSAPFCPSVEPQLASALAIDRERTFLQQCRRNGLLANHLPRVYAPYIYDREAFLLPKVQSSRVTSFPFLLAAIESWVQDVRRAEETAVRCCFHAETNALSLVKSAIMIARNFNEAEKSFLRAALVASTPQLPESILALAQMSGMWELREAEASKLVCALTGSIYCRCRRSTT
jgi:hypothetical protein